MADMNRREAVQTLAAGAALAWTANDVGRARRFVDSLGQGQAYAPKFFKPHEWRTVRFLVDVIIPRDEKSGSATDAGVPEFMDFIMTDRSGMQEWMRGGLHWLDAESERRTGTTFLATTAAHRKAILDDIAWPDKAPKDLSQGVAFFNRFRDLTCTGFYSSKMGVHDLQYIGNTYVQEWKGCPQNQLDKLGVSYGS